MRAGAATASYSGGMGPGYGNGNAGHYSLTLPGVQSRQAYFDKYSQQQDSGQGIAIRFSLCFWVVVPILCSGCSVHFARRPICDQTLALLLGVVLSGFLRAVSIFSSASSRVDNLVGTGSV